MNHRKIKWAAILMATLLSLGTLTACEGDIDIESLKGEKGDPGETGTPGEKGEKGDPGIGIQSITTTNGGSLHIVYTDGTSTDVDMPICSHQFGDWTDALAPTCTSIGYQTRTCSACGWLEYHVIPKLGHNYENDGTLLVEPTEEVIGKILHACAVCGTAMVEEVDHRVFSEGLAFTLINDDTAYEVSGIGTCTDTDIRIPPTHEGLPVVRIGEYAFACCNNLTQVKFPNSINTIGNFAFFECKNLTTINLPKYITSIGMSVFENCSSLTSVTIPGTLNTIGVSMFENCTKLSEVIISEGITSIDDRAFQTCTSLTSIIIPDSVTNIGVRAFCDCSSLANVALPQNLTSLESQSFGNCTSLTSIVIPASMTTFGGGFSGCDSLTNIYISDLAAWCRISSTGGNFQNYDLYLNDELVSNLIIPNEIEHIPDFAFMSCRSITSLTIPEGTESIGRCAFNFCINLNEISFPENSLVIIEDIAFGACPFTSFAIPDTVTTINTFTFHACQQLTDITIPKSITKINIWAFRFCESLTSITYLGTIAEWQAIEKDDDWDANTPTYTIHCTDGTIAKDGTITPAA